MTSERGMPTSMAPDRLEQIVQQCTPEASQAADILNDYLGSQSTGADWDRFVRHNWMPVLSLALGPHWQSKYESEVAAIIALQLSVQSNDHTVAEQHDSWCKEIAPIVGSAAAQLHQAAGKQAAEGASKADLPQSSSTSPVGGQAALVNRAQKYASTSGSAHRQNSSAANQFGAVVCTVQHAPNRPAATTAAAGLGDAAALVQPLRNFSLECVDVEGKRRRLRRKRAASPDLCGAAEDSFGTVPKATATTGSQHAPPNCTGGLQGSSTRPTSSTDSWMERKHDSAAGSTPPHALSSGQPSDHTQVAALRPALQQVLQQVSHLNLGGDMGSKRAIAGQQKKAAAGAPSGQRQKQQQRSRHDGIGQATSGQQQQQVEQQQRDGDGEQEDESRHPPDGMTPSLEATFARRSDGHIKAQKSVPGEVQDRQSWLHQGGAAGGERDVQSVQQHSKATSESSVHSSDGSALAAQSGRHSADSRGVAETSSAVRGWSGTSIPADSEQGPSSGQRLLQASLLDSLGLVQELSQRIVTDLRQVAESRGLTLPEQISEVGPLPLSMLLGGALIDRMDLLGRAAVHVAAATGRADVVRQLASAGCSINKPLPMDYRVLLRQHPDMSPCCAAAPTAAKRCRRSAVETVPPLSTPTLQYCTALHLAALHGHLGVVEALLEVPTCDVNAQNLEEATPLHLAAYAGEPQVAARLCRAAGADISARDHQGRTPLHLAAAMDWEDVVVELWARGAAIDLPDVHGWTALHYAACHGHTEVAGKLIIAGSHVQAAGPQGATPAHLASDLGHASILTKLLMAGYMPDARMSGNSCGRRSPSLPPAGHAGSQDSAVSRTKECGAGEGDDAPQQAQQGAEGGLDGDGHPCLPSWAGCRGECTAWPAGATALHLAAAGGHLEVVQTLLKAGTDPAAIDASGRNALDVALDCGQFHIGPALLHAGCSLTTPPGGGSEASAWGQLQEAVAGQGGTGDPEETAGSQVQRAGQRPRGPSRDARDQVYPTPSLEDMLRWLGSEDGCVDEGLLECVTGDEPVGWGGRTLLECAAAAGKLQLVRALLGRRCMQVACDGGPAPASLEPRAGNPDAAPPAAEQQRRLQVSLLAVAVQGGALGVAGWLLDRLAGRDSSRAEGGRDARGEAHQGKGEVDSCLPPRAGRGWAGEASFLLHTAAKADHRNLLRLLLLAGADPLAPDAQGRTALHAAAAAGAQEAAALILCHASEQGSGVDPLLTAVDHRGWTALHWAAWQGLAVLAAELAGAPAADLDAASSEGETALHLACKRGCIATTYALLEAKCCAVVSDGRGWLPLHYAALRGDLALFNLLFAMSAPHLSPAAGAALLTCAIRGGSSEMVGIILLTGVTTPAKCAASGQAPVHVAAREGSVEALQYLHGMGFSLTGLDEDSCTPLHHAPMGYSSLRVPYKRGVDHNHVAAMLVAAGCSVDACDSQGRTPLHLAARSGCSEMVGRFLALSRNFDARDADGWTPLCWACSRGHALAAEALLLRGADPWACDGLGRVPLHYAAEGGHLGCVSALVRAMVGSGAPQEGGQTSVADVQDTRGCTPLALAADGGHPECVAVLLEHGMDNPPAAGAPATPAVTIGATAATSTAGPALGGEREGQPRRSALHLAAARGLLDIAQKMLATGRCHPNAKDCEGWLPLHHAAAVGHAQVAQLLLSAHSDVDDVAHDGDTPLHKAALGGHLEVVQLLLRARCQVDVRNTSGSTPLYNASSQDHHGVVRELLGAGASVDAPTTNGCSPLYIAANNGARESAALLLEAGASPDGETHSGCTPLHAAALNGHAPVVVLLLEWGCDVDVQSQNGSSALHNAVSGGHVAVVTALLEAGADCDVQNSNGNTALHLAGAKGWLEVAEKLLQAGPDVHIRNSKGWAAVQSAANSGFFDIVLRLVQHGAAWRHKGEADVVRLLSKKSSYKASYVEGRLRLAEKELHRRRQQQQQQQQQGGPGGAVRGVAAGRAEGAVPASQEAQAAADAAMQELLRAEQQEKEKAERQKAKKQAKRQQRKAAATEQAQQPREEVMAGARQEEGTTPEVDPAGSQAAAERGEGQRVAVGRPAVPERKAGKAPLEDSASEQGVVRGKQKQKGAPGKRGASIAEGPEAAAQVQPTGGAAPVGQGQPGVLPSNAAALTGGSSQAEGSAMSAAQSAGGGCAAPKGRATSVQPPKVLQLPQPQPRQQQKQQQPPSAGRAASTGSKAVQGVPAVGDAQVPRPAAHAAPEQSACPAGRQQLPPDHLHMMPLLPPSPMQQQQQQHCQAPPPSPPRPAGPYAAALAGWPAQLAQQAPRQQAFMQQATAPAPAPAPVSPAAVGRAQGLAQAGAAHAAHHAAPLPAAVAVQGVAAPRHAAASPLQGSMSAGGPQPATPSFPHAHPVRYPPLAHAAPAALARPALLRPTPGGPDALGGGGRLTAPMARLPTTATAAPPPMQPHPAALFPGEVPGAQLHYVARPSAAPNSVPGAAVRAIAPPGPPGSSVQRTLGAGVPTVGGGGQAPALMKGLQDSSGDSSGYRANPFVPLFGLQLPSLPGLVTSVDWSMPTAATQGSSGSSSLLQGSLAVHHPGLVAVPQHAGSHMQEHQASSSSSPAVGGNVMTGTLQVCPAGDSAMKTRGYGGIAAATPVSGGRRSGGAAGMAGIPGAQSQAASPSDESSIESEADDLLSGIHSHVICALGPQKVQSQLPASKWGDKERPQCEAVEVESVPGHDSADDIDDVLRMQPWLLE